MTSVALLHRDPALLGRRLGEAIAGTPGLTVIGVAGSLPALRELFAQGMPDLLIVDLMLPAAHVNALLADLRRPGADDRPRLLVLAVSADDPRVTEALRRGADSYFAHAHSQLTLPAAIEQLVRGESDITPQIARQLKSHFESRAPERAPISDADRRLLQWIAEGFLISEVAHALRLNVHAVGVRIGELYRRWQADVRTPQPPSLAA
jgi:DNA-binding NarL/FixJ family response regulator